ncbi:SRPBCC domain-containing protein [Streptomyces sp. 8N616]|uniref:SRPBCC domain-containing protein n=1 Tax=Streptomyces sp. 8N616 TaxID=3457414 RepID=UPI003FD0F8F1
MEHEVFVPFSADTVRQALADPARVSRCIPGFQRDSDESSDAPDALAGPVALAGRLRLRIGSSTITYRGRLRITEQDGGDLAVEGEGTEARGSGSVKVAMNVRLSAADGGSRLACTGTVRSEGRLADLGETAAATAGRRLLDRFAAELASGLESAPIGTGDPEDDNQRVIPGIPSPEKPKNDRPGDTTSTTSAEAAAPEAEGAEGAEGGADTGPGPGPERPESASVFETEVPPPSLDPHSGTDDELGLADDEVDGGPEGDTAAGGFDESLDGGLDEELDGGIGAEPPAEAAHARRTMIGRSAEEVDHAPPRGRYAPVPAPEATATTVPLRWAAPAAAALIASAVVVSRILRRRR